MKNSEFVFDNGDEDNSYGEDYKREVHVDAFAKVREHVEFSDLDLAASIINREYINLLATYHDDPIMLGLMNVVSSIEVTYEERFVSTVRSRTRTLCVPHRVAHEMRCSQDVLFLALFERCRVIVDRTAHVDMASAKVDLSDTKVKTAYNLAISAWGSALARCYVSSTLPERLYINSGDLFDCLFHGFDPQSTVSLLNSLGFDETAIVYKRLYEMHGQEPFHIELGRLPPTHEDQVRFFEVFIALYHDILKNNNADDRSNNGFTQSDEEDHLEENTENVDDNEKQSVFDVDIPIPDFDIDDKLGKYLNDVIANDVRFQTSKWQSPMSKLNSSKFRQDVLSLTQECIVEAFNAETPMVHTSPIPGASITFHDYSLIAQGFTPCEFEVEVEPKPKRAPKYALLLDVSGSMYEWWPFTRSLVRSMLPLLDMNALYGFSGYVTKLSENFTSFRTNQTTNIGTALHEVAKTHDRIILISDLDNNGVNVQRLELEHLITVATFPNKGDEIYQKLTRSGSIKFEDSCLCNVLGKIDIKPMFLSDLT